MTHISVAGVDPGFANWGMARMVLDLDTMEVQLERLALLQTEKQTTKTTRQSSDDYRRAVALYEFFQANVKGCDICFAEIPSGSQHSRSALGFGICLGILASSPSPLIEVQPFETKMATIGKRTATKAEMIEWAISTYPDGEWLTQRGKAGTPFVQDNEHLADACAVIHAGVRTNEFQRLRVIWRVRQQVA